MLETDLVLDLGGGKLTWRDLLERFPKEKVRCVEFNVQALETIPSEHLIYRDIDRHGLPLHDNSVQYVRAQDVLEHMRDLQFVVNEVWRVLKHGGIFEIKCPSKDSLGAWGNPDHVRILNTYTIDHFANSIPNANIFTQFEILKNEDDGGSLQAELKAIKEGVEFNFKGSPIETLGIRK